MEYFGMKKNKTILVTGATSGVGRLIALKLAERGDNIIATGRNLSALEEIRSKGITVIQSDLSNAEGVLGLVNQLPELDVAIFSAGIGTFEYATETENQDIMDMISVNVQAPILLTKYLAAKMKEEKGYGQLIYIGSQAGKVATPKSAIYAATKHALIGYTNALRMELKPYCIAVTCIHPGPIDTPFLDKADRTASYRSAMKNILLQPEKVADATIRTIGTRIREVNLPRVMGITSKFYAVAPALIEKLGKSFFYKK